MPKINIVNNCYECRYFNKHGVEGLCLWSETYQKVVNDPRKIPSWCEMPDLHISTGSVTIGRK